MTHTATPSQQGVTAGTGQVDGAASFAGDSGYLGTGWNFSTTTGVTVSAWVNRQSDGEPVNTILKLGDQSGTDGFHWLFQNADANGSTRWFWQYSDGSAYHSDCAAASIPAGEWHHVAVAHQYDAPGQAGQVKWYIDGECRGTLATPNVEAVSNKFAWRSSGRQEFRGQHTELGRIAYWRLPNSSNSLQSG